MIGDSASGGGRSSSSRLLKTFSKVRLPGFEPVLYSGHALSANGVLEGSVFIRCCRRHEERNVAGTVLSSMGVKVPELSQYFLNFGLSRFGNVGSKDHLIPRFPENKEPFPEKAENVRDPLGPSIRHMAMWIIVHLGMLEVSPEDRHTAAEKLIPPNLVLLVDQWAQRWRELIRIEGEVTLEPAFEAGA
jgi:hypothetical protein